MPQQDQTRPGDTMSMRDTFNLLHLLAALARHLPHRIYPAHVRRGGVLGWNGIGALVVILFYGTFARAPEMFGFLLVWLLAVGVQRVRTTWAVRNGRQLHSRYDGHLWVGYAPKFIKKYRHAVLVEFVVCFVAGIILSDSSQGLGKFVLVAAWCVLIAAVIDHMAMKLETRRMRDAELEMRARMEIYQGKNDDF